MPESAVKTIDARRKALGLSVAKLAAKIKNPATERPYDAMALFRWFWGKHKPSRVALRRAAEALDHFERKASQ